MPSVFHEQNIALAADAHLDQHGESVVYIPRSGRSRSIQADIDRDPPAPRDEQRSRSRAVPLAVIKVKADPVTGITAKQLDLGGDKIKYQVRIGETAQERVVQSLQSQDGGFLYLEVR